MICFCLLGTSLMAQMDTLEKIENLKPVLIKATKIEKPWLGAVNSIYDITPLGKSQFVQNSLQEYLLRSPSIFTQNANNKAQDLRISIRGFGARSAFGVRGVKIIVDGIPETTADGQGQLDNLNLGIIERIEVLNNGSAALYGNASGGVVNISTTDERVFDEKPQFLHLGLGLHAFGGQQYQLTTGKKIKNTSIILHANHHQGEGYRDHSAFQSTNFNLRVVQQFSSTSKIEAIVNYMNSPVAEDPGGVEQSLFDSIPSAARELNEQFNAGESINQFKAALRFTGAIGRNFELNAYGFYSYRNFDGRLPFEFGGIIDLKRDFFGQGTALTRLHQKASFKWRSLLGYDLANQIDDRHRFENLEGEAGAITLNQSEEFFNLGFYWINDFTLKNWIINAALRYDINKIEAVDQLLSNGDDSGQIDLNDFNYALGIAYQFAGSKSIFVNYSTSFETPTLNELSNNPDGSGFNPDLKAQFANHFELGIKGYFADNSSFQSSIFFIQSQNELLPFELETSPGQTFFRNIGETNRLGLELMIAHSFNQFFTASTNWAVHRFSFTDYELDGENLSGNRLPGLPNFQGFIQLGFNFLKNFQLLTQQQFIGEIFLDNNNAATQSPVAISNLTLKYTIKRPRFSLFPYLGCNNIFGAAYADNIRINAFGRRYFEAAPGQFLFGGLRLHL